MPLTKSRPLRSAERVAESSAQGAGERRAQPGAAAAGINQALVELRVQQGVVILVSGAREGLVGAL